MAPDRSLIHLSGRLRLLVRQRLWLQVLIGMALGVALGVLLGPAAGLVDPQMALLVGNWVALPGKLFLLAIQFVVVPLVVASVIRGIAAHDTGVDLQRLGGWTTAFFLATTVVAVVIGVTAATLFNPGGFIDGAAVRGSLAAGGPTPTVDTPPVDIPPAGPAELPSAEAIPEFIVSLFPRDPLTTFVSGNMLQIVLTAVIIGAALATTRPDQRQPLLDFLAAVQAASMVIVGWVLRFAPLAVFGLLANITARVGLAALIGTGVYMVTVVVSLAVLLLFYLAIVAVVGHRHPRRFLVAVRDVMLLAFSTSSSAAVMPVSLNTAEHKLHVRPAVARFIIPVGTTINMAGTALYQGVAAMFLAQIFQVDIGISGILLIVVMATGAAIGSPGTPGVGIIILATILNSVGIPPAGIAILLGVDRLLDMCRTAVNVTGDLVACITIDRLFADFPEPVEDHLGKVKTPAMPAAGPPPASPSSPAATGP